MINLSTNGRKHAPLWCPEEVLSRFWDRVRKEEDHWFWTGACDSHGYGVFVLIPGRGGKLIGAHKFLLELYLWRKLRPRMYALHTRACLYRHCVKPECLYEGTMSENMADMVAQGRWANKWYR